MTSNSVLNEKKPVFFDKKGWRGRIFTYLGVLLATAATAFLAFFVVSVLINPFLPQIRLKQVAVLPQKKDTKLTLP